QARLVRFLESIDVNTVPFVSLTARRQGNQILVGFDSLEGVYYTLQAKPVLTAAWAATGVSLVGNGQHIEVPVNIDSATKFLRLTAVP
ncbi:MAG TPA: hypothetical protein VNM37_18675, partial [Candidatus Dormibacteraeota bacterium]|nr:hypothetical protein [Candidatus Dormibacteraeota bacterium]